MFIYTFFSLIKKSDITVYIEIDGDSRKARRSRELIICIGGSRNLIRYHLEQEWMYTGCSQQILRPKSITRMASVYIPAFLTAA